MTPRLLCFAALIAATQAPAFADEPLAPGAKAPLICRGSERSLGTRIRTGRRCQTAEQWRQEEEAKGRVPQSLRVVEGQREGPARPQ